jgi:hypothetical protein
MLLPDVFDLLRYWSKQPPVHELIAAYMGIKFTPDIDTEKRNWSWEEWERWADETRRQDLGPVMAALGGQIAVTRKK